MDKKSREIVMAKLYFKNKDYAMAEKSFKDHLSTNPEDVAALKLLAQVYEQNKRFDKAFEMYERCYLAEPDRTGVLLDICRILLMNDVNLQRIDQKKWLDLAAKYFPSNPIILNLKSMLFTLPDKPPVTIEKQLDDPLSKILEKLSMMESRLERIEDKLNQPQPDQKQSTPVLSCFSPPGTNLFAGSVSKSNIDTTGFFSNSNNNKPISVPEARTEEKKEEVMPTEKKPLENTRVINFNQPPPTEKQATPVFGGFSSPGTNLFAESISRLNIDTTSSFSNSNNIKPFSFTETKTEKGNEELAPTEKKPLEKTGVINFNQPPPTEKQATPVFGGFSSPGTNLFAESISRLNINTTGLFSSPNNIKPFSASETKAEKEEEELVPNEELPIENTCDMTPIELKTGEEDEDVVFEHRCKLFRCRDGEWKERGLGPVKVLKHRETGKGRLIMRRDAIGLVCLNCWDLCQIVRARETQVRWGGVDASEPGPPVPSVFLIKFKTPELTDKFISILTDLYPDEKKDSVSTRKDKPDIELIYPILDQSLVDKARKLQLPDLFYHTNQDPCKGCDGCQQDES